MQSSNLAVQLTLSFNQTKGPSFTAGALSCRLNIEQAVLIGAPAQMQPC